MNTKLVAITQNPNDPSKPIAWLDDGTSWVLFKNEEDEWEWMPLYPPVF